MGHWRRLCTRTVPARKQEQAPWLSTFNSDRAVLRSPLHSAQLRVPPPPFGSDALTGQEQFPPLGPMRSQHRNSRPPWVRCTHSTVTVPHKACGHEKVFTNTPSLLLLRCRWYGCSLSQQACMRLLSVPGPNLPLFCCRWCMCGSGRQACMQICLPCTMPAGVTLQVVQLLLCHLSRRDMDLSSTPSLFSIAAAPQVAQV